MSRQFQLIKKIEQFIFFWETSSTRPSCVFSFTLLKVIFAKNNLSIYFLKVAQPWNFETFFFYRLSVTFAIFRSSCNFHCYFHLLQSTQFPFLRQLKIHHHSGKNMIILIVSRKVEVYVRIHICYEEIKKKQDLQALNL